MKKKLVCPDCGDDNVVVDAAVKWDVETQTWVIANVRDFMFCRNCGGCTNGLRWIAPA